MSVHHFIIALPVAMSFVSCSGGSVRNSADGMSCQNDSVDVVLESSGRPTMTPVWDYYPQSADMVSVCLHSDDVHAFDKPGDFALSLCRDSVLSDVNVRFNVCYSKIEECESGYSQVVILGLKDNLSPGKYVVTCTGDDTLRAEFEVVSSKDVNRVLDKKIYDYFSDTVEGNDTVKMHVYSYGVTTNDTIEVDLRHNSPEMREMFYREVLDYSALKFTGQTKPDIYTGKIITDTAGITMTTVEPVYPDTVSEVRFVLNNNGSKTLCYGTPYKVARLTDGKWEELYQNGVWDMPLFLLSPGGSSEVMTARLRRPINNITAGEYLIYKDVYFEGDRENSWNICARFSIR